MSHGRLTLKGVKLLFLPLGLVITKTGWGNEYRVRFKGDKSKDAGYFTDDLLDAYKTGLAMTGKAQGPMRRRTHGNIVISSRTTGYVHGRTRRVRAVVGERVQLHAGTDHWMRGDRYGVIVGVVKSGARQGYVKVLMDRSGRTLTLFPRLLSPIK